MKNRTLFTITAAVLMTFGAGFLLVPELIFALYGIELDAAGIMLANVAGAAVFALGSLALYYRKQPDTVAAYIAARMLLTFFILKAGVTLLAQLQGVFNTLGWSIVVLDVLLTAAFGYIALRRRPQRSE